MMIFLLFMLNGCGNGIAKLQHEIQQLQDVVEGVYYLEYDVNFDGQLDVVLIGGRFGAQGSSAFDVYLQQEERLIHAPSFFEIPNPTVDIDRQIIFGSNRNSAASHDYRIYRFVDGEFVMTEKLTIEWHLAYEATVWHDEVLVEEQWQEREFIVLEDEWFHPDEYWQDYWFGGERRRLDCEADPNFYGC